MKSNRFLMRPAYDLDKIKFATDGPTFERAVSLYESGKVTQFKEDFGGHSAGFGVFLWEQPGGVS